MTMQKFSLAVLTMSLLVLMTSLVSSSGATSGPMVGGAELFKAKCAMCHGADGSGSSTMGRKLACRDLRSAAVQGQSDTQLTAIITNGKGKMPAFSAKLSGAEIQNLVAFIRSIKQG